MYGVDAAFISASGYHHHIGLNTWDSKGGGPAALHTAGLFLTAILYAERKELAIIYKRIIDAKYPFTGFADHGASEALYLNDPDVNGVELFWDRPKELWPQKQDGSLEMFSKHLEIESLLNELK